MILLAHQHVGQRRSYRLRLVDEDGNNHPIAGKPTWRIVEHRVRLNDGPSPRPLAKVEPAPDGLTATVTAFAWPGMVVIEVQAEAPHPQPIDPLATPQSTTFTETINVMIDPVPPLSETLAARVEAL